MKPGTLLVNTSRGALVESEAMLDALREGRLGVAGRVNLGSFYTPAKYVRLVGDWLLKHGVGDGWTVADLSCGYGAFFALGEIDGLRSCRYLGNFNVPFIRDEFASVSIEVAALAKAAHPEVFNTCEKPDAAAEMRVMAYIRKSLKRMEVGCAN